VEVVLGHCVASVLTAADATNANLMVLGHHRKSPLKDVFVGSTADQLLRLSKRPVLVVPGSPAQPYQRMLAAVDFSDSSRHAVEYATSLLPQVPIELLHVYAMSYTALANLNQGPAGSENVERHLRQAVADDEKRFFAALTAPTAPQQVTLRAGNVLTAIPEEVASRGADQLVVGTHGRRGVARAVLGSVAAKLAHEPVCDVLVVS
jgi:nucleotide-binding universal stress UspA family protein